MRFPTKVAKAFLTIAMISLPTLSAHSQSNDQQEAAGSNSKTEIEAMQAIENAWSEALLKHDQYALEGVLAPSFVDISAEGEVTTRNQQIARLFLHDSEAISFQQKVASVRTFGDIALVNGTYILSYTRDGHAIDDKGIFSHVFQRARARWQCINSQRTFVVEQGAARRPSVLPFHLPGTRSETPSPKPPATSGGPNKQP